MTAGGGVRRSPARRTLRGCAPCGDDGQVMLLVIAYAAVALLLVSAVVSATAVHLDRKALLATADQAALAGAGALDLDRYYARDEVSSAEQPPGEAVGTDGRPLLLVSDASVRAAVETYLAEARAEVGGDLVLVAASTPDGVTAQVTLRSLSRPAWLSWVTAPWSDGIVLEVTSSARAS